MKKLSETLVIVCLLIGWGVWPEQTRGDERRKQLEREGESIPALTPSLSGTFEDQVTLRRLLSGLGKEKKPVAVDLLKKDGLLIGHAVTDQRGGPEFLDLLEKRGLLPVEREKAKQLNQISDLLLEVTTPPSTAAKPGAPEPNGAVVSSERVGSVSERSAASVKHVFASGPARFVSKWPESPNVLSEPVPDAPEGSAAKVYFHTHRDVATGDVYQIDSFALPGLRKFSAQMFAAAKEEVLKVANTEWVKDSIQDDPGRTEATRNAVYVTKGNSLRTTFRKEILNDSHFYILEYSIDAPANQPIPESGQAFFDSFAILPSEDGLP